jgi:CRP/FNR family transcriptional regulator, cyclic AMP receptor protein
MPGSPDLLFNCFRAVPLFRGLTESQLEQLAVLFEPMTLAGGDVLFEAGAAAKWVYILAAGEIVISQADQEVHRLRPPVTIGELGAVTGLQRESTAVAGDGAHVWRARSAALLEFFKSSQAIGLCIEKNLLDIAADKIQRDQARIQDMRANLVRTQKAMKRMRDFLLESVDTAVSSELYTTLEGLIEKNRRVNYRVSPPSVLAASARLDGGREAPVVEISRTHVSVRLGPNDPAAGSNRFAAVLNLGGPEIPISGQIIRAMNGRITVELDLLIEEYAAVLEGYLTRVQMVDFLV